MLCKEARATISAYIDDALSLPARVTLDEHLRACPVCRTEVAEIRQLRRRLSNLARPTVPADLAANITDALTIEAAALQQAPKPSLTIQLARWVEPRLMPYSIGSFASVILFVAMFVGLRPHFEALHEAATQSNAIFLVTTRPDINQPVTPQGYAAMRAPFAEQSPSLNPDGALAALTGSYADPGRRTRSQESDDMIVVADVFSNGAASLAEVVQAPRDRRMLDDFELALRQNAAFVPASLDRRPDTMRVVFALQKVDVWERNF
jgi:anti-sigma factor RsiW